LVASDAGRKVRPDEKQAFPRPSRSPMEVIEGLDFWSFGAYY
jgi:hypothetical protein